MLQSLTTFEQHEALSSGAIDIGFLRPPVDDPHIDSMVILRESLVVLLPADHPACWSSEVSLSAIAETPFLRIASRHAGNLGQVIDDLAKREGVALNAVQDVENVLTLLTLVSLGVGFSIMPDYVAQLSFRNIVTRPLTGPTVKAELMAAWRRDNAKAEVAALVRRLRELPADDL